MNPSDFSHGATVVPCPRCVRGTTGPDSNGSYWRCAYCKGSGKIIQPKEKE